MGNGEQATTAARVDRRTIAGDRGTTARQLRLAEEAPPVELRRGAGPDPDRPYLLWAREPSRLASGAFVGGGHKNRFSPEDVEAVLAEHASGVTIRDICGRDDMPQENTWHQWIGGSAASPVADHEALINAYARSKKSFLLHLIYGGVDVAAGQDTDTVVTYENDNATVRRSEVYLGYIKWMAEKLMPEHFGPKIQVQVIAPELDLLTYATAHGSKDAERILEQMAGDEAARATTSLRKWELSSDGQKWAAAFRAGQEDARAFADNLAGDRGSTSL